MDYITDSDLYARYNYSRNGGHEYQQKWDRTLVFLPTVWHTNWKLTPQQYNDVYEVNYDFINNVRYLMDDVVRGYDYALERYYDFLDVRNDDLRWILSSAQYRRFMEAEHFYRPIYAHENKWQFRIYLVYNNVNFFLLWQTASLC